MKCKVGGCNKQLDEYGWPTEYCDYQQGRCPNQKADLTILGYVILFGVVSFLLLLLWLTT